MLFENTTKSNVVLYIADVVDDDATKLNISLFPGAQKSAVVDIKGTMDVAVSRGKIEDSYWRGRIPATQNCSIKITDNGIEGKECVVTSKIQEEPSDNDKPSDSSNHTSSYFWFALLIVVMIIMYFS